MDLRPKTKLTPTQAKWLKDVVDKCDQEIQEPGAVKDIAKEAMKKLVNTTESVAYPQSHRMLPL